MNNIRQIWTPQDSIDTAQAFHMELHNAERGRPERKSRLFSVSRERKARYLDTLAVALLMILMALFGCVLVMLSAPHAQADDADPVVYAYAASFGGAVCSTLDSYPSYGGIYGIAQAISEDGLSFYQAGQVIAIAAMEICPQHLALVKAFAQSGTGGYA